MSNIGDFMIYLKKNDKLIIIIAVVVIIIAAIGLAAYSPPDDDDTTNGKDSIKTYNVMWETHTKTVNLEGELYAGKNSPFSEEVTIGDENIVKVNIEISWEDDSVYGIFMRKGEDTLTADITYNGATETWESVYNGTYEFSYSINSIPYETSVEAETEAEALEKINEEYTTDDSLTFTIDVNVQTGEKIFRLLKFIRDKGNDFMLTITYEYYYPTLTEENDDITETGTDTASDFDFYDDDYDPAYLGILVNAGLTRW